MENKEKNKELFDLLKSLGFRHILTQTSNQYHVNEFGSQVRVSHNGLITFLNNKGNVVHSDYNLEKREFIDFSKQRY